ncbi:ABC transporter ATP-binding protein [Histidinibacterium aquaticum]|uniref:ABC transporter ATP-binding protein n=1 Tax=Histidinibacterium aquaticum TaxID=2613962 RepID=A0A5J5GF63_9RHOB|nr:ABC transporter ATP-binding protein [Histidinibacterium aquaticum]KAA9006896.1 ABC transporter ATP-binding protein [Histidinibacterium aquaticum]
MIRRLYDRWIHWAANLIQSVQPADGPPPRTLWRFIAWCLKGAWPILALATFISAFTGASEVLTMWLLGEAVDAAATGWAQFWADYWWLVVLSAVTLLILRPLFFGASATFQAVVINPSVFTLTLSRLHRWTLGHAVTFFDNDFAGRLAQKQMQAARSLTEAVVETVNAILFGLASVIGALILVGAVNLWLMPIVIVWFAAYAFFLRVFLPRIRVRSKARAAARAMVTGQVVDTITNIKTVKLFARADHEDEAALEEMANFEKRSVEFGRVSALFRLGLVFLAGTLPIALVGAGIWMGEAGGVTPGDIAAMGSVAIRLAQMTGWISFTLLAIYGHIGEVEDGMHTLTPPHTLVDAPDATELKVDKGEIVFEDVTFGYGRDVGGVEGIRLTVKPGEKLGIVGASGAGKSTLLSLLLRLYDPEKGRVTIDGQDISKVTQESLRAAIGMVTQETAMFNRTARDNIVYGRPEATEDELISAAEKAEAHEFILDMEDHKGRQGYEAHLGERGVKLSGGQRQRIALARAMIKDAPILVLDEATSALDSEVEAAIQEALERAMEGKTVIAIAHRLSTISDMDRIIVLDHGRIAEEGTHDELIARAGLYARFWDRQSGGFAREAAE